MGPATRCPYGAKPRLLLAYIAVAMSLLAAGESAAQPGIEWLTPAARPGGGPVLVLLRNGAQPAQRVTLSWLSREGRRLAFGAPTVPLLAAGAGVPLAGRAPAELAVAAGDSLLLRVDFVAGGAGQSRFAWLPVGRAAGKPPLNVQVVGPVQSLVDYETRRILLQLTDTGSVPLRVGAIRTQWPRFIAIDNVTHRDQPVRWPLELAPGATLLVAYDLRLAGGITPGQQALVFDVPVSWRAGGDSVHGNAVASTTLSVAVLGESDLLKVLALPSLLFVPGFLILVTLSFLWPTRLLARWRPQLELPSRPGEPAFWVFSITVSMLVWAVVRWVWKPHLLAGYNAGDVVVIWVGSLAAALIVFVLTALGYGVTQAWKRSPMHVLRTLGRNRRTLVLPRVFVTAGDRTETGYLLHDDPASSTLQVVPALRVRWKRITMDERSVYESRLAQRDLEAATALEVLDEAMAKGHADLFWKQGRTIPWPVQMQRTDVTADGRDLLLQVEPRVAE